MFEALLRRGKNDRAVVATPEPPVVPDRPSIGLALGGGAARGFAHIGVLRTLAKHGLQPDVIVGTSIGAVVGGCFAAGQLDEFEAWSRTLTVRGVLGYLDISLAGSGLIGGKTSDVATGGSGAPGGGTNRSTTGTRSNDRPAT